MKEFIAAGVQIAAAPNKIKDNIEKSLVWLEKAVKEYEAELIVFPETITTGFTPNIPVDELYHMLSPVPGELTKAMQDAAKKMSVHIIWPTYSQGPEKNIVLNSSILIDHKGEVAGIYNKTHPFPTERVEGGGWCTAGTWAEAYETTLGKIGMIICYDGDFPELSRVLALKGAEIITRPSAFLRSFDIWNMTNCGRAYDNHVYMIAVNAIGPDAGDNYYFGHSMIVDPIANRLAQGRGTEEIIYAKLDPDPIKYVSWGTKTPMIFDHLEDRNVGVYREILTEAKSGFEPSRRIPYTKAK